MFHRMNLGNDMSIIGSAIIIAGAVMFMTVRFAMRKDPAGKNWQFLRMLGLMLMFYGCLKLIFGV
ncbi:hypothetical protein DES40_0596 [Litorimonas taeanensis]|uniref:Uncharacterized protein n=2 Tax=Litorimonas taeanensis TaxID=568099 RepID=A0A420WJT1_9PROT|nr:hypothetical protein DES40_0596 [Litorimonas taeanensis]